MKKINWPYWLLGLILIGLDQASKWLVTRFWPQIIYQNPGIAFGIFSISTQLIFWIILLCLLIFIFFVMRSRYRNRPLFKISTILIIGGGITNLIDRIRFGHVIDFLGIGILPTFNLADLLIIVGCVLITVVIWQDQRT